MSALFNFHSFLTVVLLGICACTYVKIQFPALLEQRTGGERKVIINRVGLNSWSYESKYSGGWKVIIKQVGLNIWSRVCNGFLAEFRGVFWKAARIGERLSPWVGVGCFTMGVSIIFF